ncbi:MAG: hypothetical protein H0U75_06210 [Legionella sp.]|nr:hypothetical protein [Legionella sp.]
MFQKNSRDRFLKYRQNHGFMLSQNPFAPACLDITNPNLPYHAFRQMQWDGYYLQEKQTIALLKQEHITEKDYNKLFLLVNTFIPPEQCIAHSCWQPIAKLSTYESFKAKEKEIKSSLVQRFADIQGGTLVIYKTQNDNLVYLLPTDIEILDPKIQDLLKAKTKDIGYFDNKYLFEIEQTLKLEMDEFTKELSPDDNKLKIDTLSLFTLDSVKDDSYKRFQQCKKRINEDLPFIYQCIIKMRFQNEFDEDAAPQLHEDLENSLITTSVRLFGFDTVQCTKKHIQEVLNQLLFNETGLEEIARLVHLGANPNALNHQMRSVLRLALLFNHAEKSLQLLLFGADPNNDSEGDSDLIVAINNAMPEALILELIKKTRDIEFKNQQGETALILAINKKLMPSVINKLIENTKELDAKTKQGYKALDFAIEVCPRTHCSETIKKLITSGASVKIQDIDGNYPLIQAAYRCNVAAVTFILECDSTLINESNHEGDTPLMVVLKQSNHPSEVCEIIDILIKKGATPKIMNNEKQSGFSLAKKCQVMDLQLATSIQWLSKTTLDREMLLLFINSLMRIGKNKQHRLAGPACHLFTYYLKYLTTLGGDNSPKSLASLKMHMFFLQNQYNFPVQYFDNIVQDIVSGSEAHTQVLTEYPDLIDQFSRSAHELHSGYSSLPTKLKTSRSFLESTQINYGEGRFLYDKYADYIKKQGLEFGEEIAFILSDPRFRALPEQTIKLMNDNKNQCLYLIKKWGLNYEQFNHLTQSKLDILSRAQSSLDSLNITNLTFQAFIGLDEERLRLLLNYPTGLKALLDLHCTFERLNDLELSQLNVFVTNPGFLQFASSHKLPLKKILTMDSALFRLLSDQIERLIELMDLNISLNVILELTYKDLLSLLVGNSAEKNRLETSLMQDSSSYLAVK